MGASATATRAGAVVGSSVAHSMRTVPSCASSRRIRCGIADECHGAVEREPYAGRVAVVVEIASRPRQAIQVPVEQKKSAVRASISSFRAARTFEARRRGHRTSLRSYRYNGAHGWRDVSRRPRGGAASGGTLCPAHRSGASERRGPGGVRAGRADARADHRRRLLGQPAARGRLRPEHLARVPVAGADRASADVRTAAAARCRAALTRSRRPWSGRASISACGRATASCRVWGTTRDDSGVLLRARGRRRRDCWSSSITAATSRASSSTSPCSKATRSSGRRARVERCRTARRF